MNKKELVEYISKTADITKVQAEKALNGCPYQIIVCVEIA